MGGWVGGWVGGTYLHHVLDDVVAILVLNQGGGALANLVEDGLGGWVGGWVGESMDMNSSPSNRLLVLHSWWVGGWVGGRAYVLLGARAVF